MARREDIPTRILSLLATLKGPLGVNTIAHHLGTHRGSTRSAVNRLHHQGLLEKPKEGRYQLAPPKPPPATPNRPPPAPPSQDAVSLLMAHYHQLSVNPNRTPTQDMELHRIGAVFLDAALGTFPCLKRH